MKDDKANGIILKMVNVSDKAQDCEVALEGVSKIDSKASVTVLRSEMLDAVNSLENSTAIVPTEQQVAVKGKKVKVALAPYSFSVVKMKIL